MISVYTYYKYTNNKFKKFYFQINKKRWKCKNVLSLYMIYHQHNLELFSECSRYPYLMHIVPIFWHICYDEYDFFSKFMNLIFQLCIRSIVFLEILRKLFIILKFWDVGNAETLSISRSFKRNYSLPVLKKVIFGFRQIYFYFMEEHLVLNLITEA